MLDYNATMERINNYARQDRYEEIIEKFIMVPLSEKEQISTHINLDTPKDQLDRTIKEKLDEHSVFCTNRNYLKTMSFVLVDDSGEVILDIHGADDVMVSRCKIPFETETDVKNFTATILWLEDQIDKVLFLDDENIQLNYTVG